eukprot:24607_1
MRYTLFLVVITLLNNVLVSTASRLLNNIDYNEMTQIYNNYIEIYDELMNQMYDYTNEEYDNNMNAYDYYNELYDLLNNNVYKLLKRQKALKTRERKETAKEKRFSRLLWPNRHAYIMHKLATTNNPLWGNTATGQHIIGQHINPHGNPIMISMHKHMSIKRPKWKAQGLFTNLKRNGYYMIHPHKRGDHSTVTKDEQRYGHGSDFTDRRMPYASDES